MTPSVDFSDYRVGSPNGSAEEVVHRQTDTAGEADELRYLVLEDGWKLYGNQKPPQDWKPTDDLQLQ